MNKTILLTPCGTGIGLYAISLGFVRSLENRGIKVSFITPFAHDIDIHNKINIEEALSDFATPLPTSLIDTLFSNGEEERILEFVLGYVKKHSKEDNIIVVEGAAYKKGINSFVEALNHKIASALSSDIVLITKSLENSNEKMFGRIKLEADKYGGVHNPKILGCIINKVGAPLDVYGNTRIDFFDPPEEQADCKKDYEKAPIPIIAAIPWKRKLMSANVNIVEKHLSARIINKESYQNNPVLHFALIAAGIERIPKIIKPGVMLISSGDRSDVIVAACMSFLNGSGIAGLILTGGHEPNKETITLCNKALEKGFPILLAETDSLRTSLALQNLPTEISSKEGKQVDEIKRYIASKIDIDWVNSLKDHVTEFTMSPSAFRFSLMEKARALKKTIVLPESSDPRILQAASFCSRKEIASIVLLGDEKKIKTIAKAHDIELNKNVSIVDPKEAGERYLAPLLEIRKSKGLSEKMAREYLLDPIVVATMMLKLGEVDGLVAGAITTTADVVRPALKIIKTAKDAKLVSSIFFMCLEDEVVVYGDCAVNLNPTAEELADIAIQSAESAKRFGIDPKVAMISYSTGSSGTGKEVEKVREATKLVREKKPDLLVDGPLQYDAAKVPEVAKTKAPNSPVAGNASVFIFPDLNTANTTYKAVQRTADVLSIGPMLQGLAKPVNDLSRGATVDDIVFTIIITSIQN